MSTPARGILTARLIASGLGLGYFPIGPGTVGSLAALGVAWVFHEYAGAGGSYFIALAVLTAIPGLWAADFVVRDLAAKEMVAEDLGGYELSLRKHRDPQFIVVDEVVGQWLALAGVLRWNWKSWLAAFVLFRLFDIWKPAPVRQLERLSGGLGILADDAMAGLYAALVLFAAGWFNLY
jgi:phosphatidylglycerophosphatase A